jgi:hypothetical protein
MSMIALLSFSRVVQSKSLSFGEMSQKGKKSRGVRCEESGPRLHTIAIPIRQPNGQTFE